MKQLEQAIWEIQSDADFNELALEIFRFQSENNPVYAEFLTLISAKKPTHFSDIPRLPIQKYFRINYKRVYIHF